MDISVFIIPSFYIGFCQTELYFTGRTTQLLAWLSSGKAFLRLLKI